MTLDSPALRQANVACPFCGLGCDDLDVARESDLLHVAANGCPISIPAFAARSSPTPWPTIKGERASLDRAVARAASILRGARSPLILGLGTDVAGTRAALALAERIGAVIDHLHGDALRRNTRVLQDRGWVTATLSEARNRADLILFFGADTSVHYPRFLERVAFPAKALFPPQPRERAIVLLGPERAGFTLPDGRPPQTLPCPPEALGDVAATLRCLVRGRPLQAKRVAGIEIAALVELAARLKAARYGVIVWSAGELDFPHADLAIEALVELIKDLNRTTRCVGLPLAGGHGDVSASQVAIWQTGFPLPLSFARGYPEHDGHRDAGRRVLARQAADALVWISTFDPKHPLPDVRLPTVALTHPGRTPLPNVDVHVPTAIPGLDHAGHIFRGDGVVALPLRALRGTNLPSVAQVLAAIEARLGRDART